MIRMTSSALALLAIAALTIVGCGKEDVTDLNNDWTKLDNDVRTKLTDVKNAHQELVGKLAALPAGNTTDTATAATLKVIDAALKDHEAKLGEIDSLLAGSQTKRDEAAKSGKRADFEAAWNAAKPDYEAAVAKLDEIKDQTSKLSSEADKLGKPHAADTTVAVKHDTVVAK